MNNVIYDDNGFPLNVVSSPYGIEKLRTERLRELADMKQHGLTIEQVRSMSRIEINQRWKEISKLLGDNNYGKE